MPRGTELAVISLLGHVPALLFSVSPLLLGDDLTASDAHQHLPLVPAVSQQCYRVQVETIGHAGDLPNLVILGEPVQK